MNYENAQYKRIIQQSNYHHITSQKTINILTLWITLFSDSTQGFFDDVLGFFR